MRNKTIIIRWILLLAGITFTILCRFIPNIAEWYARMIYPTLSAAMSAFSSLFPFSLEELLVVGLILWIILYPIWKRKKDTFWQKILFREAEMLTWVYVWFYLGWGINYFRHHIYTRLQTAPVAYEEQQFKDFLEEYTKRLNATYQSQTTIDPNVLREYISTFYSNLTSDYGLSKPQAWQKPKTLIFTSL